jgi:hypothetical protein
MNGPEYAVEPFWVLICIVALPAAASADAAFRASSRS